MYTATGLSDREYWVERYMPLVKRIAYHMMARLPASVQVEDLIQAGMLGLLDAIQRFQEGQGAQFETYATQRIRGAILDELRAADWMPRSVRRSLRRIEQAIASLEQRLQRPPSEQELARALGVSLEEYQAMLSEARGVQIVHYDDFHESEEEHFLDRHAADPHPSALERIIDEDFRRRLAAAIDELPEREKLVMALYYEQELNLKEIGAVLGVTESRVCQIHSQAVARLRARLRDR
ncbi:RNA polymerase sigma factor FliA [Pelomicrobium sp. G1]|uniref:RNA polymerase sigma factor FliA n=1 Tax=unclassified Pelomicrobium TaxID=2815318 RepID=UPI003F768A44